MVSSWAWGLCVLEITLIFSPWNWVNFAWETPTLSSCCFKHHVHRYTAFPPFFHTYNEELQKTSQIKVPYFTLICFLRLNKVAILAYCVVQTLPALPATVLQRMDVDPMQSGCRWHSHLLQPTYCWRVNSDPSVPKSPSTEAQAPAAWMWAPRHPLTTINGIAWSSKKTGKNKRTGKCKTISITMSST